MAKMGKLTPEEEARNKSLLRERDRERKRMKRMNPEYRKLEQERDRDRKKARRSNEAFRQLEKLRDKLRKERKKGILVSESVTGEFVSLPTSVTSVEPDTILSDTNQERTIVQRPSTSVASNNLTRNVNDVISNIDVPAIPNTTSDICTSANSDISHLNKGVIYTPTTFTHHPLPLASVALMPQLCHPILYPPNGIKQEFMTESNQTLNLNSNAQMSSSGCRNGRITGNSGGEELETSLIEPEIILRTSSDIISTPHLFQNPAHTHHLHQQQCSMFQHVTPQAHLSHMRVTHSHAHALPPLHACTEHHQAQYGSNKNS